MDDDRKRELMQHTLHYGFLARITFNDDGGTTVDYTASGTNNTSFNVYSKETLAWMIAEGLREEAA